MDTPDFERLTLLERAQLLHDSTLRRHGEMLERHEADVRRWAETVYAHVRIQESQDRLMECLTGIAAQLQQTMAAIEFMLDRGNGH